jgi:hypothetical protein
MAITNFNTWEVFIVASGDVGIDSATQVHKNQTTSGRDMVFKDFGADAFPADEDFTHYGSFKFTVTGNYPLVYGLTDTSTVEASVTRPVTLLEADAGGYDSIGAYFLSSSLYLETVTGGVRAFTGVVGVILLNTKYWFTIFYNATSKTVTLYLYSDAERTNLLGSDSVAHNVSNSKRWGYTVGDYGTLGGGNFEVYDIDMGEVPSETILDYERGIGRGPRRGILRGA